MKIYNFSVRTYIFFVVFVIATFFSIKNALIVNIYFFLENISIRESFYYENDVNFKGTHEPGDRYFKILFKNISDLKSLNFNEIKKTLIKIKNLKIENTDYLLEYKLIEKLKELSNIPTSEKKFTAIYIPKNIDTYLNISCDRLMSPFLAPAISNIVMLDGLPLNNNNSCYGHLNEYGYPRYERYNKIANLFHLKPKQLCDKAKKEGLKKVIELVETHSDIETKVYKCD